jgi:hypothetical protein
MTARKRHVRSLHYVLVEYTHTQFINARRMTERAAITNLQLHSPKLIPSLLKPLHLLFLAYGISRLSIPYLPCESDFVRRLV